MTVPPQKFFMDPPEESAYFFEAARENKFVIQRCAKCGDYQFYPRKICTHCGSTEVEWAEASGRGVVHTFTVIHRGMPGWREEGPYVAAIVELDEGPRLTTNVVECSPSEVKIDMPVEVVFVDEGQYVLPRFRLVR